MKPIRIRQYWLGTSPAYEVSMADIESGSIIYLSQKNMERVVDAESKRLARLRHVD